MQNNHSRIFIITIMLYLFQVIINNTTSLYLDTLTLLVVIALLNNTFSIITLAVISLFADLGGHWYLGTHVLAMVFISFITKGFVNFYKICSTLQKLVLNSLFTTLVYIMIFAIDVAMHKSNVSWPSFLVEIIIINPIVFWILNILVTKVYVDVISQE